MINSQVKIKYNKWKFIKDEREKELKSISNVNLETKKYVFNNSGYQIGVDYYYGDKEEEEKYKNWPVVYIIEKDKDIYIGETQSFIKRFGQHLSNDDRFNKFENGNIRVFFDDEFNKSAILDIENSLIRLVDADGTKELDNVQFGQSPQHDYYNRTYYLSKVETIWEKLREQKVVTKKYNYLKNLNHYKYSPYTMLTDEQYNICLDILEIIIRECFADDNSKNNVLLVEGGAGTGKTVLASFILHVLTKKFDKDFIEDINREEDSNIENFEDSNRINRILSSIKENKELKIAFVIQKTAFRETMINLVSSYLKISKAKASKIVVSPSTIATNKDYYDVIIVDEAHRLKRAKNIQEVAAVYVGNGCGKSISDKNPSPAEEAEKLYPNKEDRENLNFLTALRKKCNNILLFYDSKQRVHSSDITEKCFKDETKNAIYTEKLNKQMRVEGGEEWDKFVDYLFDDEDNKRNFYIKGYDVRNFDNPNDLFALIKSKDEECKYGEDKANESGLCRVVAGYAWEWVSKKDSSKNDVEIGKDFKKKWNTFTTDWPTRSETIDEIGSRDTIQGYDLNYCGVIFGHDICYKNGRIEVDEKFIYDSTINKGNIKYDELRRCIIDTYKMMLRRGIKGCYMYICDDELRKLFDEKIKRIKRDI